MAVGVGKTRVNVTPLDQVLADLQEEATRHQADEFRGDPGGVDAGCAA
jgi:hypothetical protein